MATASSFTVKPDDNVTTRNISKKKNANIPFRRTDTYVIKGKTNAVTQRKAFGNVTNVAFTSTTAKTKNTEKKTIQETSIKTSTSILDDKYPAVEYAPTDFEEDDSFHEPNWCLTKDELYDLFKPPQKPSHKFCKENNLLDDLPNVNLELENVGPGEIEFESPSLDFVIEDESFAEIDAILDSEDENVEKFDSFNTTFVVKR